MEKQPAKREKSRSMDLPVVIFGTIAFMYFTADVLKPLALSVLLSFALTPVARFFERRGIPRGGSVILTVVLVLGTLGCIGYVVGKELATLSQHLPEYREDIKTKLDQILNSKKETAGGRIKTFVNQVTKDVNQVTKDLETSTTVEPADGPKPQRIEVVANSSFFDQVRSLVGPYLEGLGIGALVFVLVLFMLMGRERLRDRVIGLFGNRHISLTTRTMEEIGHRISRYLATLTLVNSCVGLTIGLGLWMIGLPFAVLWGCLAAMLRFIPYVGPTVAFVLPMVFAVAHFPSWIQPLEVLLLFGLLEASLSSYIEPMVYGKSTGLSALGLLIAAMFWTWLWGTEGLLLSTPMTVCLAVLGKYLPRLKFFAILLEEQSALEPDVRLYQRLVALDKDGAVEVIEEVLKTRSHVEVFDGLLVPTLARLEIDAARGELDDEEQEYVLQMVGEAIDWVGEAEVSIPAAGSPASDVEHHESPVDDIQHDAVVVGIGVQDTSDELVLKMLGQLLTKAGVDLHITIATESTLKLAEQVAELSPKLIILSHLPIQGLASARYLLRRLRTRFPSIPIIVCRWSETETSKSDAERLTALGASYVASSVASACNRVLCLVSEHKPEEATAVPLPG